VVMRIVSKKIGMSDSKSMLKQERGQGGISQAEQAAKTGGQLAGP
jgi:hypothetical protein